MKIKRLSFLLLFIVLWLPGVTYAQAPGGDEPPLESELPEIAWRELQTENFTIVYADSVLLNEEAVECECGVSHAEYYADFVDTIYEDLSTIFETDLELPVNLRLFPTEDSYYSVNPLARRLTGVVAHALNSRDEIAIALPRTLPLTDEQLLNNIRHEMTHLFASSLSDSKLNAGFQEGIAQYIEVPGDDASQDVSLLEQAIEQERLLTWEEFDQPERVYGDSQVAYPQSLSVVSFLVDRYGLDTFREFLAVSAEEPGYRSALEVAYGMTPDELEEEWQEYLPDYIGGRWQINALYAFDLTDVTELVEQGAYTAAETRLTEVIALLEATDQTDVLTEAEALLVNANQGRAAAALADEARAALQTNDYNLTIEKSQAAIDAYNALGYQDRNPEIESYIERAEQGQQALAQLDEGEQLLGSLRFSAAEETIYQATERLQSLNNQAAAQEGQALLADLSWRKRLIVYALLAVALLTLVFNALRRIYDRFVTKPLEVEFT